MTWFIFAVLSAGFWGIENFLHKLSAQNKFSSSQISVVFGVTACVLSAIFFLIFEKKISNLQYLLIFALLNAITFFSSLITRIESLKRMDASIHFPISKTFSLFVTIILSLLVLREEITLSQYVALLVTLVSVYLVTKNEKGDSHTGKTFKIGLLLAFVSATLAAIANFTITGLEESGVGTYSFSFFAYAIGFLFSYLIGKSNFIQNTPTEAVVQTNNSISLYITGIFIGIFNFFGLVFFIEAMRTGLFSVVGAVNNLSLLLTIVLSIIIFREKPTLKQVIGIILAFLALILFQF